MTTIIEAHLDEYHYLSHDRVKMNVFLSLIPYIKYNPQIHLTEVKLNLLIMISIH